MNTLSQKQRDCLEKAEGITITTNPRPKSAPETFSNLYGDTLKDLDLGMAELQMVALGAGAGIGLGKCMAVVSKVNVGTVGHVDHGNTVLPVAILDTLLSIYYNYEEKLTLKENTEVSCKDRTSGVSLPKVKTGSGHWKPFYQTNKY